MISTVSNYLDCCRSLLLEPTEFFRHRAKKFTVAQALTFGLVSAWLSAFFLFLFKNTTLMVAQVLFENWFERMFLVSEVWPLPDARAKAFLMDGAILLLNPFMTLWYLFICSSLVAMFAKIFAKGNRKASMELAYRVLGFAAVGLWFAVVPVFGGLIAYVAVSVLAVIGVREVYQLNTERAIVVVLAPQLMFLAMLALTGVLLVILVFLWVNILMNYASPPPLDWTYFLQP